MFFCSEEEEEEESLNMQSISEKHGHAMDIVVRVRRIGFTLLSMLMVEQFVDYLQQPKEQAHQLD